MIATHRSAATPTLRQLRANLGLSREKMGRLLSVSAKTVENWEREGRWPSDDARRGRLATLAEICELGLTVYTPEGFIRFMTTPMKVFDYHTALHEFELGHADRVLGALAVDYEGAGY